MAHGDGIGIDHLNMMISLTKLVIMNKSKPQRFKEYTKIWLYEANDLPEKFNNILSGLFLIVRGDGSGFIFDGQHRLLNKLRRKLSEVDPEKTTKLAEYYRTQLKIQ